MIANFGPLEKSLTILASIKINPLTPNVLQRHRAVRPLKFPVKNLERQRCAEGFNSGVKGLNLSEEQPGPPFLTIERIEKFWKS
jgi:hypothetical protein